MIDHVVVDVEIKQTIEETPGGWGATDKLGVAVAVVYEFRSDRFRVFGDSQDELMDLRARLDRAERISGYNIWKFDFPVIYGLPGHERAEHLRFKTNDLLMNIWRSLGLNPESFSRQHGGWKLDQVVRGTLPGRPGKIAEGAMAPVWYKQGLWGKVVNYCVDDVSLERDLAIHMDEKKFVVQGDTGQRVEILP